MLYQPCPAEWVLHQDENVTVLTRIPVDTPEQAEVLIAIEFGETFAYKLVEL